MIPILLCIILVQIILLLRAWRKLDEARIELAQLRRNENVWKDISGYGIPSTTVVPPAPNRILRHKRATPRKKKGK